jgi:hypothetical protein
MYKQFRKETPQGVISKTEFKEVMKQMGVVDNFLQDLIFNVFDTNKDGTINFQEFVAALSVMTRGTPDEKLECTQPFIFAPPPLLLPPLLSYAFFVRLCFRSALLC